eukprot:305772-Karenia_brevis.AAC.1
MALTASQNRRRQRNAARLRAAAVACPATGLSAAGYVAAGFPEVLKLVAPHANISVKQVASSETPGPTTPSNLQLLAEAVAEGGDKLHGAILELCKSMEMPVHEFPSGNSTNSSASGVVNCMNSMISVFSRPNSDIEYLCKLGWVLEQAYPINRFLRTFGFSQTPYFAISAGNDLDADLHDVHQRSGACAISFSIQVSRFPIKTPQI